MTEEMENVQSNSESIAQPESENSGEIGRFKSADELYKAYTNLEREFTKRSQKIKLLEKELSEKTRPEEVYMLDNWQEKVDEFVKNTPAIAPFIGEISEEILNGGLQNNKDCLELATARVILKNYKTPTALIEDGDFLENHIFKNEKIRDRIIKDYLLELNNVRTVKTIGAGGQPALSSAIRPKNLSEAGKMVMEMAGRGK